MAKKILIVDDEPSVVASLEFLMDANGYDVRTASNGDDALRLVMSFVPDLILLDVMMPLKNGFEVCQKIRETPDRAGVKIIMLTAKTGAAEVQKGLALGADDYVTKPFSTRDLIARVGKLLGDG